MSGIDIGWTADRTPGREQEVGVPCQPPNTQPRLSPLVTTVTRPGSSHGLDLIGVQTSSPLLELYDNDLSMASSLVDQLFGKDNCNLYINQR